MARVGNEARRGTGRVRTQSLPAPLAADVARKRRHADHATDDRQASPEIFVVGINQHAPRALLEQMASRDDDLSNLLRAVLSCEQITEATVLSTCMRIEIYAVAVPAGAAGLNHVRAVLRARSGRGPQHFDHHLYAHTGREAMSHLFRVAAGIDSAVLGEGEVLRQVRAAWEFAEKEGAGGSTLRRLFGHSVEVGKRARSETSIARGATSLSRAVVSMAAESLGSLGGRTALVAGAGEIGQGIAHALASVGGIREIAIANRTWSRAAALAARCGGRPIDLDDFTAAIERADLVVTSTSGSDLLVKADDIRRVLPARAARPLLIVDVAVPRDVDPAVGDLPGVTLLNLDDLRVFAEAGLRARGREIAAVEVIVAEERARFLRRIAEREAVPVVVALRERAEQLRKTELDRFRVRMSRLDEDERAVVEALTLGLVAKLLHDPCVRLRAYAGSARGDQLIAAAQTLFDLPELLPDPSSLGLPAR